MNSDYSSRLAERVATYRERWPDRYEAIEMDVIFDLAVPLHYRLKGLPEWVKPLIAEKVAERVRSDMGWPSEREWRG